MALQEEDDLSEYGEDGLTPTGSLCSSGSSSATAKQTSTQTPTLPVCAASKSSSSSVSSSSKPSASGSRSLTPCKDKDDKAKSGKSKDNSPPKEERDTSADSTKKSSKIASLIPKGGKSSSGKKDGSSSSASSGIPKPGLKAPSTTSAKPQSLSQSQTQSQAALNSSGNMRAGESERAKLTKVGQGGSFYGQRSCGGSDKRTSMTSSTSTSALSGTCSENDCTMVAPADPCLSPTKGELVYSKTAKQCLEEISGEDPETRRMRTVKNIADLRQNLEETMSSLRVGHSHSTLETTFDTTVTTEVNGRSLPTLTTRSSPMAWRLGQSQTPRLQAGDAPSMPTGYSAPRSSAAGAGTNTGRYSGHSDPSRFLTDGGLHLYARNPGRASDGGSSSREGAHRGSKEIQGDIDSWDDSSSVSSGLSDTLDNISTDDLNTPAYSAANSSRKAKGAQSQKGSRSKHAEPEVSSSWVGAEDLKKVEEELEASMDPGSGSSRWKPSSSSSSQNQSQYEDTGQKAAALAQMSQTGSWRRGMTAQVGITPPRTKGTTAALKTPGKTDDAKASEKVKIPSKSSAGIQRSPSDAGRSSGDEGKKPPTGIVRPPTTGSFGYKKIPGTTGTLITSSGATLTGGSATLGKAPKSSAALSKGTCISGVRKTSLDGSQPQDDGILLSCSNSKVTLQYRSLPRPAKSSSGAASGRSGHRSSSSSIDSNVSGKSTAVAATQTAQLRSSFKQAFSKKKTKSQSAPDEMEEMTDSLPSSPKLQHDNRQGSITTLRSSTSTTELCECTEAEAEIILQLKNELREKELKLTDIRLEALSSAHHLDQIREAMNRMQNEIEILKAENDRLKSSGSATPTATPVKTTRPPSETSSTSSTSSRQSLGLSLNNLNITDTIMSDILQDDGYEGNLRKESRSVRIVVSISSGPATTKGSQTQKFLIGSIGVSGKTKWDVLDGVIRRLFKEYMFRVDPVTSLGLSSNSIICYRMGEVIRCDASEVPELLPCGYLVGNNNIIKVHLKGVTENSIDSLVFDTLIPKPIIQRYLNLLMEHRRIILSGPSGTGKSFLAAKLAEYIISQMGQEVTERSVASFNVDQNSSKDLRQYLSSLAEQCNSERMGSELPTVVILDNLHHIGSLSDIFNGFLNCKYHKCPYVIGTMSQGVSCSPNLELHHNFRWVLCTNHTEPVKGFLGRFLRRKLIETEIDKNMRSNDLIKIIDWIPKTWQHLNTFLEAHSSSDVTIGPRLFLSCPMDVEGSRVWFTDLWNYSLVPYLLEAVREGLQLYGKRAVWEDPSKWVNDTYPWNAASLQQDGQSLLQLRPEDVGYDGYASSKEGASSKQVSQSDTEGDPLMNMLLRLQEAANYSSTQSCDSDSTSHHDDQLDSSLESAL
uniref:Neuron navigator 3 n=2 Tax=Nothobranchius korthausae TaxID=1143690 RepID=A0A1A8GTR5_9TELE